MQTRDATRAGAWATPKSRKGRSDATGGRFNLREVMWLALAGLALWLLAIVLFALQLTLGSRLAWDDAFARSVMDRAPWAVLSPFIFWLVWYLHRAGLPVLRTVLAHLAALLIALLAGEALVQGVILKVLFPADGIFAPATSGGFQKGPPSDVAKGGPRDFGKGAPPEFGKGVPFEVGKGRPPEFDHSGAPQKGLPRLLTDSPGPVNAPPLRGGPPPGFAPDTPPALVFAGVALRKAYNGVPFYLLIAALAHAFFFWRNLRVREARLSLVEERLLGARADMLRLQLEPHFLFNTLNAISTLVYRDAALADDLIGRLSTLLRRLLDLRDERTIALDAEMETLRAYVGIEQARFGERLRYEEAIDAAALGFPIPVMLLQPLAENAVRHGIEPLGHPGTLRVAASLQGDELVVCIEDDGVGMSVRSAAADVDHDALSPRGFGVGLTNASVRLRAMYGSTASITAQARLGGGTRIDIRLPRALTADAAAVTISEEYRA